MEAKTNYTVVGLVAVILTSALVICALWLSVGFNQKNYKPYAVFLHEPASGLSEGSPVKYNGVSVGTVLKIKLNPTDPREVELILNIEEGTPITTSTVATLIAQGITGTTYVGLSASTSDLTPLRKRPEEPYPIIPSKPSLLNQLDKLVKDVSDGVTGISRRINKVLDDENIKNLKKSLNNIQMFSKDMTLASKDFPQLVRELRNSVNKLTTSISNAGESVSSTMKSGKTAFDKVSQQAIPPAVVLLHQLNNIAANLEKLSNELRQNPSVVIRGTTPPPPGPGEKE